MVSKNLIEKANRFGFNVYEPTEDVIRFSTYGEVPCELKRTNGQRWVGFVYPNHAYLPVKKFEGTKNRALNRCFIELTKEIN